MRTVQGERRGTYTAPVPVLKTVFWGSLGALAWTHVGYPVAAEIAARLRSRPVRKDATAEPSVAVIVAAYNEEPVIERRLENLLALDYPADKLEIVVASDASTDRTNEIVAAVAAREPRVRLLECPRGGKVAAQNRAVAETSSDVVAFSDGNATWAPTRSGTSSPTSQTRTSPTSAVSSGSRPPPGRIAKGRTGATR